MKRPTIDELEQILNDPEDYHVEIMPDGSIKAEKGATGKIHILSKGLDLGDLY